MCIWGQNHVWLPEIGASGVFWRTHDSAEGETSADARDCRRIWIHKWRSAVHWPDKRTNVRHFLTKNAFFSRHRTWRKLCLNRMSERSWSLWITTCRRYCGSQNHFGTRIRKDIPLTRHFILSVMRAPQLSKVPSVTRLCELHVKVEACRYQRFGHT